MICLVPFAKCFTYLNSTKNAFILRKKLLLRFKCSALYSVHVDALTKCIFSVRLYEWWIMKNRYFPSKQTVKLKRMRKPYSDSFFENCGTVTCLLHILVLQSHQVIFFGPSILVNIHKELNLIYASWMQ